MSVAGQRQRGTRPYPHQGRVRPDPVTTSTGTGRLPPGRHRRTPSADAAARAGTTRNPPGPSIGGSTKMSHEIDRRSLLRLSGIAGASALAIRLLAAPAGAATARGSALTGRAGRTWLPADAAADRIVASVRRPRFPSRYFPITRFGAVGDGVTDCTASFKAAIAACNRWGGGHVIVPAGTFFTGAIHLLSNVDLHLEAGSTILFSQDPNAYLPVVFTRWQGIELMNYSPPIYSYGQRNIAITGQGTLNGQADANHWWNWKNLETPDGCDPESCDGVVIDGVTFDTGDDCVAIKSGRDADGRRVNVPSQNLVIQNSNFADGHGGITIGSEMTGGVKNIYARDLTMNSANLEAGHRVKTNTLRGGYVLNSNVYRITAGTIGGPVLLIDAQYDDQTGDFPPDLTDINLTDWTVSDCEGVWSILGADASDPVGTITLTDLTVTTSTVANSAEYISNLVLNDVTVGGVPANDC